MSAARPSSSADAPAAGAPVPPGAPTLRSDLATVLEQLDEIVFETDVEGRWTYLSPAWTRVTGFPVAGAIGTRFIDYVVEEDRAGNLAAFEPLIALRTERCHYEMRYRSVDGGARWMEVRARRLVDESGVVRGTFGTLRDVHERRAADQARARLTAILDVTADLVATATPDGRVTYLNPAGRRMLALAPDQSDGAHDLATFTPARRLAHVRAGLEAAARDGVWRGESELVALDGREIPVSMVTVAHRDAHGAVTHFSSVIRDISEWRAHEAELERRTALLQEAQRIALLGNWEVDLRDGSLTWSDQLYRLFGHEPGSVAPTYARFLDHVHPDDRARVAAELEAARQDGGEFATAFRVVRADGTVREHDTRGTAERGADGGVIRLRGICQDVTAHRATARELERTLATLQGTLEATADGILVADAAGRITGWNQKFARMWRVPEEALLTGDNARAVRYVLPQLADPAAFVAQVEAIHGTPAGILEDVVPFADGRVFERYSQPLRIGATTMGRVFSFRDVSASRAAAEALARRERELQTLLEHTPDMIARFDPQGRFTYVNAQVERMTGRTAAELLGHDVSAVGWSEEVAAWWRARFAEVLASQEPFTCETEQATTSGVRWLESRLVPERDATGACVSVLVITRDVTDRHAMESELRTTTEMLRALIDAAPVAVVVTDVARRVTLWNRAAERTFGWTADEVLGHPERTVPADAVVERETREGVARRGDHPVTYETQRLRRDGARIDVQVSTAALRVAPADATDSPGSAAPAVAGAQGPIAGFVTLVADVTERKQLEARYRQAQKMEAVGQLAGGVAHDFNNLLTAVLGHAELLLRRLPAGERAQRSAREIVHAAERAAALTQQLLAFGRKQVLQARVVSVNEVVAEAERMLERVIGEDVELVARLDPALPAIVADPTQLHQVLVNLVVNARDAMPHGGRITVDTSRHDVDGALEVHDGVMPPGRYVRIAVGDGGVGMDRATQARIFEPFFTTKEVGKGTGLGLATVYGIVKQLDGYIWVYSEPGLGTTFHLYFPASGEAAEPTVAEEPAALAGGRGTVLVVEDEASVRALVVEVLDECGYAVLEAGTPEEALRRARAHPGPIDLLLTDVVMPGMNGRELACQLGAERPGVPVLYMSGYSDRAIVERGVLDDGVEFLPKPFTPATVAARVQQVLAQAAAGRPAGSRRSPTPRFAAALVPPRDHR